MLGGGDGSGRANTAGRSAGRNSRSVSVVGLFSANNGEREAIAMTTSSPSGGDTVNFGPPLRPSPKVSLVRGGVAARDVDSACTRFAAVPSAWIYVTWRKLGVEGLSTSIISGDPEVRGVSADGRRTLM